MSASAARRIAVGLALLGCGAVNVPEAEPPWTLTSEAAFPPKPAPGPLQLALRAPLVQEKRLDNGMTVLIVERPELPVAAIAYTNRAARDGLAADGTARSWGLAGFSAEVLKAGTLLPDGRVLRGFGGGLREPRVHVFDSGTVLHFVGLATQLEESISGLARMVKSPAFDAEAFRRARRRRERQLFDGSSKITARLRLVALEQLYGPHHPLATPVGGDVTSLAALTEEDVRNFHESRYAPEQSAVVVVGSVAAAEVEQWVKRHFGDWRGGVAAAPDPEPPAAEPRAGAVVGLEGRSKVSVLTLVWPCPARDDPDSEAFDVFEALLADRIRSGWYRTLRHDTAISYGIDAKCIRREGSGHFVFASDVDPRRIAETVIRVRARIRELATTALAQAELDAGKTRSLSQHGPELATSHGLAQSLALRFLNGQSTSYYAEWRERVLSLDAERLRAVVARWLDRPPAVAVYGVRSAIGEEIAPYGSVSWRKFH